MRLEHALDQLHTRVSQAPFLYRFTIGTRVLLAIGFFAPGLVKLLGERFTSLSVETEVGFFFEAMYRTGWYWQFLGAAQILAALLVLFPRTALLGALIFLPIIANIFVITISLPFTGTPVITGLMLLACIYLLCWDYPRLKPLLPFGWQASPAIAPPVPLHWLERLGYTLVAGSGIGVMLIARSLSVPMLSGGLIWVGFAAGLLGAFLALLGWFVVWRKSGWHWFRNPIHSA